MEDAKKTKNCAHCERELDLGVDVLALQKGVIGPRGFVALDDMELFCCEDCLKAEYTSGDLLKLDRRIP